MKRPTRSTAAGQAYLDLQNRARAEGRGTQEFLTLYVVERWLARLSMSPYADHFIIKGGMLLAAYNARRPACLLVVRWRDEASKAGRGRLRLAQSGTERVLGAPTSPCAAEVRILQRSVGIPALGGQGGDVVTATQGVERPALDARLADRRTGRRPGLVQRGGSRGPCGACGVWRIRIKDCYPQAVLVSDDRIAVQALDWIRNGGRTGQCWRPEGIL
jgi:hypothetical protein